jgi:hypothetical protein
VVSDIAIYQQLYLVNMWRWYLTVVAFVSLVPIRAAQDRPKVSLMLPTGIASETVHIEYFLTGPFGGYGGFVRAESKRTSLEIDPFVEGRLAENIKIIAYLPGCEIITLDFTFSGTHVERRLDCYPLGSVTFQGQVLLPAGAGKQNGEVEIRYLAFWSHEFFGISDGPVTEIRLATVRPDRYGKFETTLPDLYKQYGLGYGAIELILRDGNTGNVIAFLGPAEAKPNSHNLLDVQASYPMVKLIAQQQ